MYGNIVVAYDGSDEARDALSLAAVLRGHDGLVTAACLTDGVGGSRSERTLAPLDQDAERVEWLRTRVIPAAGRGSEDMLRFIRESGADLLVLGSSSRAELGMTLTGEGGRAFLFGCRSPVAVAPRGYR